MLNDCSAEAKFACGLLVIVATAVGWPIPGEAQEGSADGAVTGEVAVEQLDLPEGTAASEGDLIDAIRVAGNRRVEDDSILQRTRAEAGDPIDRKRLSEDIHRIYDLGYFSDVQVDATEKPDGRVIVTYLVREKPAIAAIEYEGNEAVSDDDIEEEMSLKPHTILDVSEVKKNVQTIRDLYVDKGYHLAEVDYEIRRPEKLRNQVVVVYTVREFSKVQVKEITILGNENIPDKRLKRVMKTKEGNVLSLISKAGNFKEEDFEMDLQRLTRVYYDRGYVEVQVGTPTVRLTRDKQHIYITVRIDEGQQYSVGDVDIGGAMLKNKEELMELVDLEEGETFSYGAMRKDADELKTLYQDDGYAYAEAKPMTRIDKEAQRVDVNFEMTKGEKVYFDRIRIRGNEKTRDKVIRRELEIEEGDLYSNTDVERSKRGIKRLGYFENVEVTTQRADAADRIHATVQVKERRTGNFQVGAGFSSTESFIFNAKVSQNNLFGRGQSLSVQAQISAIRSMVNLRFTEPWLFDTQWQFSANAYNFEYAFQDFTRESTGGELTLGYPISEPLQLDIPGELVARGTYKLEDVGVETGGQTGASQRPGSFFKGGITSSVGTELEFDTRNNRLFPTKGHLHTASAEFAHREATLSQTEFAKYEWESRVYVPLVWEFVLRLNGEVGLVSTLSPEEPVPLFERYFVGGPRTQRGFDYYTLGPSRNVAADGSDPGTGLSEFNIGGNKQLLLTTEIEFPILTAAGLKGVFFADAGNAFDEGQPLTLALDLFEDRENGYAETLRTAVGFGVRWRSPMGPLRFEWGFPLQRLRGEKLVNFQFSIGRGF